MSTENTVVIAKQYTTTPAPEGYWTDARGVLTPVSLVKEIDRDRDELVGEIVEQAIAVSSALQALKARAFADIQAFIDLSAEKYGAMKGGKKAMSRSTASTGVSKSSGPCRTVSRLTSVSSQLKL